MSTSHGSHDRRREDSCDSLKATLEMCSHCFDVLIHKLTTTSHTANGRAPPTFVGQLADDTIQCPLFVTWQIRNSPSDPFELRGCIGTLSPRPLATSIGAYALTSAFSDRRFSPITLPEIPCLCVSVSLLVQYESCEHCHDWIVGVHGIMIEWYDAKQERYSATYLPEVASEQGWDQKKTVKSLIRKAGYHRPVNDALLQTIKCTRYQSSKQSLTYDEYVQQTGDDSVREILKQVLKSHTKKKDCFMM